MAARHQPVRGGRKAKHIMWGTSPANAASNRGLALAVAVLAGELPALVGDDALAEKERLRVEDEARHAAQGCLRLGPAA